MKSIKCKQIIKDTYCCDTWISSFPSLFWFHLSAFLPPFGTLKYWLKFVFELLLSTVKSSCWINSIFRVNVVHVVTFLILALSINDSRTIVIKRLWLWLKQDFKWFSQHIGYFIRWTLIWVGIEQFEVVCYSHLSRFTHPHCSQSFL